METLSRQTVKAFTKEGFRMNNTLANLLKVKLGIIINMPGFDGALLKNKYIQEVIKKKAYAP